MIFARYTGKSENLTRGRVYLAKPEIDDGETVGLDLLTTNDDDNQVVKIHPDDDSWEYLEEMYTAIAYPVVEENWEAGEIVVVTDAVMDKGAPMFRVKGMGLHRGSHFIVLDQTNVFPGLVVLDVSTGKWVTVRRVDECLWLQAGGSETYRSPEKFRFSVSGGDILTEPLVKCIDDTGESLTVGKIYRLIETRNGFFSLEDDCGEVRQFDVGRFQ